MTSKGLDYDLLVIGGGINGTGIALDASGRGLKVALCEMNDLASSTSSKSSKLIHGGLRYLEYYEFRLVKEALAEREVLLKNAPHLVEPLRFILPHRAHLRPAWLIRMGLFLYDNLSKRVTLKKSKGVKFDLTSPLIESIKKGFEYSDAWVDDSRLVIMNAVAAKEKGATIMTRTSCVSALRDDDVWKATLLDTQTNKTSEIRVKALVNAAGPWVSDLYDDALSVKPPKNVRLVKGSHIIVPRLYQSAKAYILQNKDKRIVFVLPYQDTFSLIGTTDVEYNGDPSCAKISAEEMQYLLGVVNHYFKKKSSTKDIVHSFSGVRPLMQDDADSPESVTRDYSFELDSSNGKAPLLSVFGGKLTTYRKLSESVINGLAPFFAKIQPSWTKHSPIIGGNFTHRSELAQEIIKKHPWLSMPICERLVKSYGTLAFKLLEGCGSILDMGIYFGSGLFQKEVDYLCNEEWAVTLDDILWRRSKFGLKLSEEEKNELAVYIESRGAMGNLSSTKVFASH